MKSLITTILLVVFLVGCTAVRVNEPSDPERASELNAQLGLGYMQKGLYKRSMQKLEKAIKYNPENASAYHYMAELHRRLKKFDKAEAYYKKSLEIDPRDSDTQNNYGVFLCDRGMFNKAFKHFDKILVDPLYRYKADTHENIGLCAFRQGNLKKAETAFKQALAINNKLPKSLLKMSQLEYDKQHFSNAYDYFRRYIALAPHTSESLWLGVLLENRRNNKNTVASYKVLLKGKFPASRETRLLKKLESQGKI